MPFVSVARLADIPVGRGKQIAVNGRTIALFADGDRVYAISGICPHRGAPLSDGMCKDGQVMCPWHAARFDLATGKNLCPPALEAVAVFPVQVVGDDVQVDA